MTINLADNDPRVSYAVAAGATQSSFTVSFEFFVDADLNVYVDGVLKTLTTDYTVTGGDGSTGSIAMSVTGASGGSTVVITRSIDIERTTDFPSSGPFDVSSLNTGLDRIIAIQADLQDDIDRSLRLTDYDTAVSLVLPDVNSRKGTVLAFDSNTGAVVAGPTTSSVNTLASIATDVATLADIEDGTVATDAISDLAAIASNVTTSAGISANITTVAGISSDVTAVAADATDIGTVATNIASVNTVATNIADVVTVANDLNEAISEIETAANDLNEATSEIDTVATNIANVNAVGLIDSDVTTVAGIASNVTTVAGISANVTAVAGISANVTTVAGDTADIGTVAGISANVTTVAGISSNVTTVAGDSADIATVAGISSDISTVAANDANITLVGTNITGVNSFAERYRVGSSDPTTSLDDGDLAFNTTDSALKFYDGSSWVSIQSGLTDIVGDATPQLGGNLDVNGNSIVSASGGNIAITPDTTGSVVIDGLSHPQADGSAGQFLKTDGSGQLAFATVNTDLVNDTTPQLGGTLDTNGNDIQFGSSKWTIELDGNNLLFKYNGTAKIKFAEDGEIVTVDDVTSNGTI